MNHAGTPLHQANRRIGLAAAAGALAMIGVAYAAVPLYRLFCQVTGFGGTTQVAAAAPTADRLAAVTGRTIKVRFDSNIAPGLPWRFHQKQNEVTIPIGEKRLAYYSATNTSDRPITGRAVFNVSPDVAGQYFIKIACFCFTEQTLQPGETVDMPVTWYVDPAILDDPIARKIDEITLSYTFYPVDKPEQVRLSGATNRNTSG
ncbi:cytochrome c oxidase assembly protein [Sandarakinorhabdus cyanobacteriorum]|uniref:Cytochrome c oxidase assembly protein CtaG n=1 Tax=Sandarakinorhabdus cyanobacteriorum TaxID=1981098 RepID=A0A255YA76_9SPHN|nr:cytochrome c oxidase assembly protein [Sandarakinorhabdus cyanobacteriorum]OYQ26043.1 cytochrome c oxidase assembly protein [Sandarakinorhabdus cyanobacteriorum]